MNMSDLNSEVSSRTLKSRVLPVNVADRPRQSQFPMVSILEALDYAIGKCKTSSITVKCFEDSLGYVLAEDVIATEPYPAFKASTKDGYAVMALDDTLIRDVIGVVTPGCKLDFDMKPGTCVRVSTGSAVPDMANAVIQVEDTMVAERDSEGNELQIKILKPARYFQDIRQIGSDVSVGQCLIPSRKVISPAEVGVLAICGVQNILVHNKPRVALLSTGDEVLEPHVPMRPGCIRDSNKSTLKSLLIENKIPVIDAGIAKDTPDCLKAHLWSAMEVADIIVTTGSVSMGEKDLLKLVLKHNFDADIHFGRVHMKPGKPMTFSTLTFNNEKKLVFSLPGNPVSAYVCFYLFVIPCIKKMMGYREPRHIPVTVKIAHDIELDERPEFHRVYLESMGNATSYAYSTGRQQSSRLLSMQNADALLVLPPKTMEQPILEAESLVNAILLKPLCALRSNES